MSKFSDFSLGFLDSLTVVPSVGAGLYASGISKETIILSLVTEAIAGSISMGLSNYVSVDSDEEKKDASMMSGFLASIGYATGACIAILVYTLNKEVSTGFKYSIVTNMISLVVFGIIKGIITKRDIFESMLKVFIIGSVSMGATYYISRFLRNKEV
jgi:VIT1/CCC1 family predicted Fe2+/Mn2+ transporter